MTRGIAVLLEMPGRDDRHREAEAFLLELPGIDGRLHRQIDSGIYVFAYEKDGGKAELPARYSFVLVKDGGRWQIVDHHSSSMPK